MNFIKPENLKPDSQQKQVDRGKVYTLVSKEENEKISVPVDPNYLTYYDRETSNEYFKFLYLNKSGSKLSENVFGKLLVFYLYMILTSVCFIAFTLISYNSGDTPRSHMLFHVLSNSFIPVISTFALILLRWPKSFIKLIKPVFATMSFVYYSYLIIGNKYILSKVLETDIPSYGLPLNMAIIGLSIVLRFIMYHNFLYNLVLNLAVVTEYLIFTIVTKSYQAENLTQFFTLFIFLVLQIIDSKHTEFSQKKDFWLQFEYEKSFKTSINIKDEDMDPSMNTETEMLIHSCEQIKKTLKHCCSVIIFKDVKDSLKMAIVQLENIKQRIGKAVYSTEIKLENHGDIDPDDKKFISENFIDFSHINTPERSALTELTVFEFKEAPDNFPFSHYGIEKLESVLSLFGKNWGFDIWFIHNATGQSVSIIGKYLFQKWQLNEYLTQSAEVSDEFFIKIESGYHKNPYHNACHAADVLHTQLFFIAQSDLSKILTQLDIVSCIIASLGHDIGHPALTNRFLVNNSDELAIQYNDSSVLESMHSAKTFSILKSPGYNILENLSNEDWIKSRKMIIEMILETDMSKHFEILGKFRTRAITLSNFDISSFEDKCQVLGMSLKCADIGHSAKDYDLHEKWSMLVCEEFFRQGDIEKSRSQAVSMYCDREVTDIPKSQAGFIKNICLPLYEVWIFYLKSETVEKFCLNQLKNNLDFWSQKKKRRSTVKPDDYKVFERFKRILTSG